MTGPEGLAPQKLHAWRRLVRAADCKQVLHNLKDGPGARDGIRHTAHPLALLTVKTQVDLTCSTFSPILRPVLSLLSLEVL